MSGGPFWTLLLPLLARLLAGSPCYHYFSRYAITYDSHQSIHVEGILENKRLLINEKPILGSVIYNLCQPTLIETRPGVQELSYAYLLPKDAGPDARPINLLYGTMGRDDYALINPKDESSIFRGFRILSYLYDFKVLFICSKNTQEPVAWMKELAFVGPEHCGFRPQWPVFLAYFKVPICVFLIIYGFFEWICGGIKRKSLQEFSVFFLSIWLWTAVSCELMVNTQQQVLASGLAILSLFLYFPTRLVFNRFKPIFNFLVGFALGVFVVRVLTAIFLPVVTEVVSSAPGVSGHFFGGPGSGDHQRRV